VSAVGIEAPAAPEIIEKASLADWLAVLAGTLGAMMALMDISIVNSSLPKIQGEIGATPAEATWVGTAYLVAEIVVIPLCAWLERLLGMRRLLLGGAIMFTVFSVVCGLSTNLQMMIIGRLGQGLSGGVLIPTALTIVATRLPPHQQVIGLALTAVSALLGPSIGPVLGGWLTENYGWKYAFFINVPICAAQVAMMVFGMRKTKGDWHEWRNADWLGIFGMMIGLGATTTLLEEGHREQWFQSALIWQLAIAAMLGFGMIAWGQLRAHRPVIRLSLLHNRELASAATLLGVVGMLLYTGVFITPQFLVTVAGYDAQQAGMVAFIAGIVSVPAAMCYPLLNKFVDVRLIVALAIFSVSFGDWLLSGMTVLSAGGDFTLAQLLYGIGTTMTAMPLQQAVISSVRPEDAAEANAISSVTRNLGGSIGLAALASFQDQRFDLHHWTINGALGSNDPALQQQMSGAAEQMGGGTQGWEAAWHMLDGQVMQQALVMSFNDIYLALFIIGVISIPLVLFLRPAEPGSAMGMGH
jgi:MFS transporter, DHA2 family, multidrug resistance protein